MREGGQGSERTGNEEWHVVRELIRLQVGVRALVEEVEADAILRETPLSQALRAVSEAIDPLVVDAVTRCRETQTRWYLAHGVQEG